MSPDDPNWKLTPAYVREYLELLPTYGASGDQWVPTAKSFQQLCEAALKGFAAPEALPKRVADALREACYVPGHFDAIRNLKYCRWCHYEELHPHGPDCVMLLLDSSINAGLQGKQRSNGDEGFDHPGPAVSAPTSVPSPRGTK